MKMKFLVCLSFITVLLTSFAYPVESLAPQSYPEMPTARIQKRLVSEPIPAICPGGISYGETIACSIDSNETDSYTFAGNINDRVIARVQITSGNIDPSLQIDAPGGTCATSTIFNLLELNCILPTGGIHTIHVSGSSGQTGGYNLHLQRSNFPANQTAIAYGQTLSGHITTAPEMDVFAFTGSSGEKVILRKQVTSGSLDPHLRIYNPDGTLLCSDNTIFNQLEINCTLAVGGLHMIFAHGDDGQTGGYNLHLQRSNDPTNQIPIAIGQTLKGSIAIAPEMAVYKIDADVLAGDTLVAKLKVVSPNIDPHLRIYHIDGTLLCKQSTIFNDLEMSCTVPATGMYTVFVAGGDDQSGSFEICVHDSSTTCNYQVFLPLVVGE